MFKQMKKDHLQYNKYRRESSNNYGREKRCSEFIAN